LISGARSSGHSGLSRRKVQVFTHPMAERTNKGGESIA
jgi:hypothetical protein